MVLFWNHGGGSTQGIAYDQQFGNDHLTLPELSEAFSAVCEKDHDSPPFDVIGFDACLMATLDTAMVFHGFGSVLVASQDLEPGNGWEYTTWLTKLGKKTDMDAEELGKIICDAYIKGCKDVGTNDTATLSVIDIESAKILWDALEIFGFDALTQAAKNQRFYASFARNVKKSENYSNSP